MTRDPGFIEDLKTVLKDPAETAIWLDLAVQEYLEDEDHGHFLDCVRLVAEAQGGLSALARKAKLNRSNLYKALNSKGAPKFDTINAILNALGYRFGVLRIEKKSRRKLARKARAMRPASSGRAAAGSRPTTVRASAHRKVVRRAGVAATSNRLAAKSRRGNQ